MKRTLFILALVLIVASSAARAEWPLISGLQPFGSSDEVAPFLVPDGGGGALVVGNNAAGAVIVQRIDRNGERVWPNAVVATADYGKDIAAVVADGFGGAIIGYTITGNNGYAQRVSADGQKLWANGIKMYDACCAGPAMVPTGDGGAAAFFQFGSFIGFQKVGPTGAPLYPQTGLQVATTSVNQFTPDLRAVSDGAGGYVVLWKFKDTSDGIDDWHAQRVDGNGNALWGSNGVVVCGSSGSKANPNLAPDGTGGMIAVWDELRASNREIYAQRVDASGNPAWIADGIALTVKSGDQVSPQILAETNNPVWLVAWRDAGATAGVYAQRININAGTAWPANGLRTLGAASYFGVSEDGAGGFVFTGRVSNGYQVQMKAQRVTVYGSPVWSGDQTVIDRIPSSPVSSPAVAMVDAGHVFIVAAGDDGMVQRVELAHGMAGRPEAGSVAAMDNPTDHGGYVLAKWTASQLDIRPNATVTMYTVYRAPAGTGAWQVVGSQQARYASNYSLVVATSVDETLYDWFIRTRTTTTSVYWDSEVVTASSVNNLSPAAPAALTASRTPNGVALAWAAGDDNADAYAVFRGAASGFAIDGTAPLATVNGTSFLDTPPPPGEVFYVVAAIDAEGTMSAPSNEAGAPATNGADTPALTRLALRANVPNPFANVTTLRIGAARAGNASIEVFDVTGRRVASRQAPLHAGWNDVEFNGRQLANGVYLWRVRAGGETMTRKLVIQR